MDQHDVFRILGEALALGLLVGIERYKGRTPGEKRSAGVRTFAIISVLGAVSGLLGEMPLTLTTFLGLAALLVAGYWRSPGESVGLTTEVAALLVFWIGYLLTVYEGPAISLGIVLTLFLASKQALHGFARDRITEEEFFATLKFLAVVLVVYPLLPDTQLGPYGFLNPREIWGLVILVSTISYAGYFMIRWLGTSRGLKLTGLVGGLVSTTAVTMSLAERVKAEPGAGRLCGAVAVIANAVQAPRLLVLIWVVDPSLARFLLEPLLGMAIVGLLGAWVVSLRVKGEVDAELELQNPYSVTAALRFGAFFVGILLLVRVASEWFGQEGAVLASAIAGLASASAAALSLSSLLEAGGLPLVAASLGVLAAIFTNGVAKWIIAALHGGRQMALWLGGGLLTMILTAAVLMAVKTIGLS